ncbi:GABBR [Mytilus coruscus]|uniref:GABBR n=1 Tax=Mytilus coruscus TaxID=42192 RepID=A0A6J8DHJ9_MYTCO|nr:GABBR [Mytilus coruscus]
MFIYFQLGYGSSSPALSHRERFPTFFRTHPSATLHNPTRVKLCQKFGWKRIATIQETQELFTSTVEDLEERVKKAGIEVSVRQNFLTDPTNAVRNLKRQDARIIIGVFYENMARKVFCQAYKEKLYGKKYVWIIIGWYPDNWYKKKDPKWPVNCTADQIKEALEGHITTEAVVLHQENTVTQSGMTSHRFKERLDAKLNYTDTSQIVGYPEAPLAYDAVWALALALNKTSMQLVEQKKSLEHFDYYSDDVTKEIYSAMNNTRFLGVSGNVAFSSEGDRIAWTQIEQMINGTYRKLGYYDYNSDNFTWFDAEKWKGEKPPPDRTEIEPFLRVVTYSLFVSVCALAALGIIFGIVCLCFNIANKHRRCIAYSQPNMNNITIFGCMVCLISIFLLGLDGQFVEPATFPLICQIRCWLLSLGFTLGYGGMFSKIWTVHRLTTARKKEKKKVNSCELYTVLIVILVLDVACLTTWQIKDPLYRTVEIFDMETQTNTDEDIMYQPQLEHCTSKNMSVWLGVIFGYKGILLLFGIFLAYETRSVKLKQVNDSRFVGMSIYNVVVLCVITAPITLLINNQQDASFAFVSLAILLCSLLSTGLIFVPKMIEIKKRPKKYNSEIRTITESHASREEEERHQKLLRENDEFKTQLSELEDQIKDLNCQLEKRSQQRLAISAEYNNSPIFVRHSEGDDMASVHEFRTHLPDRYTITVDPCSDSGFVKSSRFSVSDQDLEFL